MSAALKALVDETGISASEWEEIEGPDSGVGVDHFFRNKTTGLEAYVNDDQGFCTVSLNNPED